MLTARTSQHNRNLSAATRAARTAVHTPTAQASLLDLQRLVGNQVVGRLIAQRSFATVPGKEIHNRNILAYLKTGNTQLGYTYPVLNSARVHSTSEIYKAMKLPDVDVREVDKGKFEGSVRGVGHNQSSWEIEFIDPAQLSGR